jgi:uncharacterized membrane protein YraQ (UPF0718 family)
MKVSEKKSLRLIHQRQTWFFCSRRCLDTYVSEQDIPEDQVDVRQPTWIIALLRNKTLLATLVLIAVVALSFIVPWLVPVREQLFAYGRMIWWAVLLGLVLGGIIDTYVPREYISVLLATHQRRTILRAVVLGFFMSFCSHGILALAVQLYKKGASPAAVITFLLASPWANLTVTLMLFSFFGLQAFFILLSALGIAVVTGLVFQGLEAKQWIEANSNALTVETDFSILNDVRRRWQHYRFTWENLKSDLHRIWKGIMSLSNMILWWILIGAGLASIAGAYVPSEFFENYMGPSLLGLMVTLGFATVIEVCSEGSAPMAFELFKQTGALGNSFVFLMAGVVTDYTEIGLMWHNMGRKTALWLPLVTVPQVILLGWVANFLLPG